MKQFTTIVVKVGSNVLTKENGHLNTEAIESIVEQIVFLKKQGINVLLVSSGAVAAGRELLSLFTDDSTSERQILAATGQVRLMHSYYETFNKLGFNCAQVMVTKEDFRDTEHYTNMENCLQSLLKEDIVPIVNENDVVSVTALMFTDNDQLAGLLCDLVQADALMILTNVDGIYDKNPSESGAKLISKLTINELAAISTSGRSSGGRGGMASKLDTAKRVAEKGTTVFIGNGNKPKAIESIVKNDFKGTYVVPN